MKVILWKAEKININYDKYEQEREIYYLKERITIHSKLTAADV